MSLTDELRKLADLHQEERLHSGVTPFSDFIRDQVSKLEGHRDLFAKLREEGKVALYIGWFADTQYSAETFYADALRICGDLGIDIELNCYFNDQA